MSQATVKPASSTPVFLLHLASATTITSRRTFSAVPVQTYARPATLPMAALSARTTLATILQTALVFQATD